MAQIEAGDFPLDAYAIDGVELCSRLSALRDAFMSSNLGTGRPPGILAGALWTLQAGDVLTLLYFDGTYDRALIEINRVTSAVTFGSAANCKSTAVALITATNVQAAINQLAYAYNLTISPVNLISGTTVQAAIGQLSAAGYIKSTPVNLVTASSVDAAINQLSQAAYITNGANNLITATNVNTAIAQLSHGGYIKSTPVNLITAGSVDAAINQLSQASYIYRAAREWTPATNVDAVLDAIAFRSPSGCRYSAGTADALPAAYTWYQVSIDTVQWDSSHGIATVGTNAIYCPYKGLYLVVFGVRGSAVANASLQAAVYNSIGPFRLGTRVTCNDAGMGPIQSNDCFLIEAPAASYLTLWVMRGSVNLSLLGGNVSGGRFGVYLGATLLYAEDGSPNTGT